MSKALDPLVTQAAAEAKANRNGHKRPPPTVEITLRSYATIPKEHIEFIWPDYIAIGKLHHVAGNSGQGKSPVTADLIARVSRGANWPDGTQNALGPRSVILLAAEDDPGDTIRPRLELAGADLSKIHHAVATVKSEQSSSEKMIALSTDLGLLLEAARSIPDLALVVIDPITNYLGPDVKMNDEAEVRQLLMPLALGSKELRFTTLTIGHFNRRERGTESLHRIMGAAAFQGVARFIYLVGSDPEDPDPYSHVLVQRRGVGAPALRYQTYAKPVEWDGKTSNVVGVQWFGKSKATAEDIVDPQSNTMKLANAKAAKTLGDILKDGKQKKEDALKLLGEAGHDVESLNVTRLLRAAKASSRKFKGDKVYSWFLPATEEKKAVEKVTEITQRSLLP